MIEKLKFYLRHSLNDLRVNGQRTIFALLCIAAGVAAIVSLQTLGVMIQDTLTGSLQKANRGDIQISAYPNEDVSDEVEKRGETEGVIETEFAFGMRYFGIYGIQRIESWFKTRYPDKDGEPQVQITYRQAENSISSGMGISIPARDTEKQLVVENIIEGGVYPFYDTIKSEDGKPLSELLTGPTDIVISKNLADDLNAKVGDTVRVVGANQDFTLRGIVPTDSETGFNDTAMMGALVGYYYLDISAVEAGIMEELKPGADRVYVQINDPENIQDVKRAFERDFPYVSITTTQDLKEQNSQISDVLNQMVTVMGLISLLIGGIGIVNTMLVIVSRRTTEVAVLKTVGLEGEQITVLFMVEAVLMGIFGSLIGILLGWVLAFVIKGVAENFLSQTLTFRITLLPPLTGFIVGILITTIFGFMPTLAAGQIRPNLVLRPTDTVVPKAGRLRSLAALVFVMLALSLVAQLLVNDLLDSDSLRRYARFAGAVLGLLMGLPMVIGGIQLGWTRGNIGLRILRWALLLIGLPVLGFLFGYLVPAVLLIVGSFFIAGYLYVMLWAVILTVAGGSLKDLWIAKLPKKRSTLFKVLLGIAFIPLWILNLAVIILMLPFWVLWRIIQFVSEKLGYADFRLALRSMFSTRGRNASTLLALVIGVFTLSLITLLANAISKRFEEMLIDETGGNVIIFAAGSDQTLNEVRDRLATQEGMKSYAVVGTHNVEFVGLYDASENQTLDFKTLAGRLSKDDYAEGSPEDILRWDMSDVDARELTGNLPDVKFYQGRQLNAGDEGPWDPEQGKYPPIVMSASQATIDADIKVGDRITFRFGGENSGVFGNNNLNAKEITFEIVGLVDRRGGQVSIGTNSKNYAPSTAFEGIQPDRVGAIVDIKESEIRDLRRSMNEVPGVFVMETRLINDLLNRIIDQFTAFPILVAGLALFTGGVVIANSVALATLERRREIGIMKAVGLQRERVLGMLLLEYGLMGLIGGLIGVGIGMIVLIQLLTAMFNGELGNSIPYGIAFELMGLCILIALVAAVLTAWRASGEKPLNVLRYE